MERLFRPVAHRPLVRKIELPAPIERCHRRIAAVSPYTAFLNSGTDLEFARWSFIACDPYLVFTSRNGRQSIETNEGPMYLEGDPFDTLDRILAAVRVEGMPEEIPFSAGGIGAFGYGLGKHIERLPRNSVDDLNLPDMVFVVHRVVIAHDKVAGNTWICALDYGAEEGQEEQAAERCVEKALGWMRRPAVFQAPSALSQHPQTSLGVAPGGTSIANATNSNNRSETLCESNFTEEQYIGAVEKALEYIYAGDIYQVNLSQRFRAPLGVAAPDLYNALCEINPAPFGAYIDCGTFQLISSSPERFLLKRGREVETRPIKGTRPRGATPAEDAALCRELLDSEKDNAELAMIVDLERNDLGRVCEFGTVKVAREKELEKYATVSHLVSTVIGKLREDCTIGGLLRATFPGGSITGCPKIRSMEIIDEIEPHTRGFYTGSIGYIGFDGNMDLNIAIRTITTIGSEAFFHVGGGIVADSDPAAEYRETLDKGLALKKALESAGPVDDENLTALSGRKPVSERKHG